MHYQKTRKMKMFEHDYNVKFDEMMEEGEISFKSSHRKILSKT